MAQHGDTANSQLPLKGVVLCSTSLTQDARTRLADCAIQMGAIHTLDLTGKVTHLVVADVRTPKYRCVAKERPDVKILDSDWIEAVRAQWIEGGDVDLLALEEEYRYPALAGLHICVTGFTDLEQRLYLEKTVPEHGAKYSGDLTKQVTHLIVAVPEGAKYTYAKQWGIPCVSLKWFLDSLTRGMVLDESLYDPLMPEENQGRGAYRLEMKSKAVLGKRGPDNESQTAEDTRKRKLRRTASTRLEGQSQDILLDISTREANLDACKADQWHEEGTGRGDFVKEHRQERPKPADEQHPRAPPRHEALEPGKLFSGWYMHMHGFDAPIKDKLRAILEHRYGAQVVQSASALENAPSNPFFSGRCVLVPHVRANADCAVPQVPPATFLATEWWVERCIHSKQILDPDKDPLSRPMWDLSIPALSELTVCSTGFTGVDLRQIAEVVDLAGATYQEKLLPSTSVLISSSSVMKREKAFYARKHGIPAVTPDWLWACLQTKRKASFDPFRIELPALDPKYTPGSASNRSSPGQSETLQSRSGEAARRNDHLPPTRLLNSRRRRPTPSLLLQAARPTTNIRPPPFVHEDDDEESQTTAINQDPLPHVDALVSDQARPLEERSPNASPKNQRYDFDLAVNNTDNLRRGTISEQYSHDESPALLPPELSPVELAEEDPVKPAQPQASNPPEDLSADLASLSRQLFTHRDSASSNPAQSRRRDRKLGRAVSGISSRSISASVQTSANAAPELLDGHTADGDTGVARDADALRSAPPSTQLGYEMPGAEAHRLHMAKKVGTSFGDDSGGKRLASIGTVRDGEHATSAGTGRARGRQRGGV